MTISSAVTGLLKTHFPMNFCLVTFLSHPCRLVSSGAALTSMDTEGGTFWVMFNMSWYHNSIFPYVGFSISQVLLVLLSFRLIILHFEVMYWLLMSEGSSIENLDVWHWCECLGRWFGLFQTVSRLFRLKIWEVKFFFNSLLAGLTNHPYMVFPNLGPSLKLMAFYSLLKVAQVLKAQWRW